MRTLGILGVECSTRGVDVCFQEWVKRGCPEALDMSFGPTMRRVTLVTEPQKRFWGMTRGRSCSAFYNQQAMVFASTCDETELQREFDDAFKGLSEDAPIGADIWGNADACLIVFIAFKEHVNGCHRL